MDGVEKKLRACFYKLSSGKEPVREWLLGLDREDRKAIGVDIKTVEFGWPIGMPMCKPLGGGLYEVRSNLRNATIARVFSVFRVTQWFSCMHLLRNLKRHQAKS